MNKGYNAGYFLAAFTYEKPFLLFLPLMGVVYQMSKFIKAQHMLLLVLGNIFTAGVLGKYLVNERVK